MSDLTIKTNNVPRDILEAYELTAVERADFDYLDWSALGGSPDPMTADLSRSRSAEDASFFRYRGHTYDLGEFTTTRGLPEFSPLRAWDGLHNDSFFSGVVVRYVDDLERVVVGTFYA